MSTDKTGNKSPQKRSASPSANQSSDHKRKDSAGKSGSSGKGSSSKK